MKKMIKHIGLNIHGEYIKEFMNIKQKKNYY